VRPQPGGQHRAMGTHNSVLGLGPLAFLEVIAIDPAGVVPQRPRWFDLDAPTMRAALREGPRLIHWVVRTDDIESARRACPIDPGLAMPMSRGSFDWLITVPEDGHLPGRGLVPTLIQWLGTRRPAEALPDAGLRLVALAGAHREPASIRAAIAALGLSDMLKVTYDASPRLVAMLRTPRGVVTLSS
jgi:Glyoxalase-like domain